MQSFNKTSLAKRTALLGVMSALAVVLSFLEGLIPPLPFTPPGAKPGLSNIVSMFALTVLDLPSALCIALVKSLFVLLTRGTTAFFMSLAGGILSVLVMWLCSRPAFKFGFVGIGIMGAIAHNTAQIFVSAVITGTFSVFYYYPLLLIFAVLAGSLTGIILKIILPALKRVTKGFIPPQEKG